MTGSDNDEQSVALLDDDSEGYLSSPSSSSSAFLDKAKHILVSEKARKESSSIQKSSPSIKRKDPPPPSELLLPSSRPMKRVKRSVQKPQVAKSLSSPPSLKRKDQPPPPPTPPRGSSPQPVTGDRIAPIKTKTGVVTSKRSHRPDIFRSHGEATFCLDMMLKKRLHKKQALKLQLDHIEEEIQFLQFQKQNAEKNSERLKRGDIHSKNSRERMEKNEMNGYSLSSSSNLSTKYHSYLRMHKKNVAEQIL